MRLNGRGDDLRALQDTISLDSDRITRSSSDQVEASSATGTSNNSTTCFFCGKYDKEPYLACDQCSTSAHTRCFDEALAGFPRSSNIFCPMCAASAGTGTTSCVIATPSRIIKLKLDSNCQNHSQILDILAGTSSLPLEDQVRGILLPD